ncbi:phosphoserine transaminase [Paraphotobacterium marinum]|uniref:Phosphoserine aminotransferase n=1 Tax=Paraphotobacterium marinum TaxID=1755811 RepID=A0A220VEL0_9GAMM|nr:3-phosphoserine/phosphohydroxythreonine transaminase [Paraphotobacterium marinum]ASK78612.1 phosphoserine transaminase [Paraphotobacterium marinum]
MMKNYNFSAGPAMIPDEVKVRMQNDLSGWKVPGISVAEISHRSSSYIDLLDDTKERFKSLLDIPNDYEVLFCHGGARAQFSAVPLNLVSENDKPQYLNGGYWAQSAYDEARLFCNAKLTSIEQYHNKVYSLKPCDEWDIDIDAPYIHFCSNETLNGIEITQLPEQNFPFIADMTSNILSRPINVNKFSMIYAGTQKNLGIPGLSVIILKKSIINSDNERVPSVLNYKKLLDSNSLYNTPSTYAIYVTNLILKWISSRGGLMKIFHENQKKADYLYSYLDNSPYYSNNVDPKYRSLMNVSFNIEGNNFLDEKFIEAAEKNGLHYLKGHRAIGGMRASIYNAMPFEAIEKLVNFLDLFTKNIK